MRYVLQFLIVAIVFFPSILISARISKFQIQPKEVALVAAAISLAMLAPSFKFWLATGVAFAGLKHFGGDEGLYPTFIVTAVWAAGITVVLLKIFVPLPA